MAGKRVFISHSNIDRSAARSMARYLRIYGLEPWIDERELRIGDKLDKALQEHIQTASIVAVIASRASVSSKWVQMELEFARNSAPPIPVCPVFLEPVEHVRLFANDLGLDATDRHKFSHVVAQLAASLLGPSLPEPSAQLIENELNSLSAADQRIAMLVEACRSAKGPYFEHQRTIAKSAFYDLDYALNAMSHVISPSQRYWAASSTAEFFALTGAGAYALRRYFQLMGDDNYQTHLALTAFGKKLDPAEFDTAIELLSELDPPVELAIMYFIEHNGSKFDSRQKQEIVRLVTWPARGPGRCADAGSAALRLMPNDEDLITLWQRWIWKGYFDGGKGHDSSSPDVFAAQLAAGLRRDGKGWSIILDFMIQHIRDLARSASHDKVYCACSHLEALVSCSCPGVSRAIAELEAACGSWEWSKWEEREAWRDRVMARVNAARTGQNLSDAAYKVEMAIAERKANFDRTD